MKNNSGSANEIELETIEHAFPSMKPGNDPLGLLSSENEIFISPSLSLVVNPTNNRIEEVNEDNKKYLLGDDE